MHGHGNDVPGKAVQVASVKPSGAFPEMPFMVGWPSVPIPVQDDGWHDARMRTCSSSAAFNVRCTACTIAHAICSIADSMTFCMPQQENWQAQWGANADLWALQIEVSAGPNAHPASTARPQLVMARVEHD